MDVEELAQRRDEVVILDVREELEWVAGHLPVAVHIPMGELQHRWGQLPTDRPVVCVCKVGERSAFVAQALAEVGLDAHNLDGGLLAWVAAGRPLVDADGAPGRLVS